MLTSSVYPPTSVLPDAQRVWLLVSQSSCRAPTEMPSTRLTGTDAVVDQLGEVLPGQVRGERLPQRHPARRAHRRADGVETPSAARGREARRSSAARRRRRDRRGPRTPRSSGRSRARRDAYMVCTSGAYSALRPAARQRRDARSPARSHPVRSCRSSRSGSRNRRSSRCCRRRRRVPGRPARIRPLLIAANSWVVSADAQVPLLRSRPAAPARLGGRPLLVHCVATVICSFGDSATFAAYAPSVLVEISGAAAGSAAVLAVPFLVALRARSPARARPLPWSDTGRAGPWPGSTVSDSTV